MMTTTAMAQIEQSDAELVAQSLAGDRNAFGRIVARYQTLICSLAYSRTGSLDQSEDLSQETFVAAWRQLRDLREPAKLRSWLCGIANNLCRRSFRGRRREPIAAAEPLENAPESPTLEAHPLAQAISREEEAILWRSLERIPEAYREPLILYYRKDLSTESVAAALELSEDTVRQRLARGRKLLQDEVQTFVENTLRRTAPGQTFCASVLAALPSAAGPVATAGANLAAKGVAAAKSGLFGAWMTPLLGVLGGVLADWLIVRAAPTPRERRAKKLAFFSLWLFVLVWVIAGQYALRSLNAHFEWNEWVFFVVMAGFWWSAALVVATLSLVVFRRLLAIRQDSERAGEAALAATGQMGPGARLAVVGGIHLGFFCWLIHLACRAHDRLATGVILATMVGLGAWHFLHLRGRSGSAAMRVAAGHLALAWVIVLAILNWRLALWLSSVYEINPAHFHQLLPAWVIPSLSFALVLWAGILLAITKPRRHVSRPAADRDDATGFSLLLALAICAAATCPTAAQGQAPPLGVPPQAASAIPDQFRPLYQALDQQLHQAGERYPFEKGQPRPLVAPNLCLAASVFCPATADAQRWKDLLATLDAFQAMGMNAALVQIVAPDLVLGDTGALLGFYRRLAGAIHARRMKLYVEHFVNTPFKPNRPSGQRPPKASETAKDLRDDPQGREEFLRILEQEVTLIYREIKPEYLSVLTEPELAIHQSLHLSFPPGELANWVGEVTTRLKATGASPNTLLGAGGATIEPEDFFLSIARQTNLDYVDFHLYLIKMRGVDQLAQLARLAHQVREVRPNLKATIGEAWLFKQTKEGPKATLPEIFARDNFSFWSPLDQQFLRVLLGLAQQEDLSVVVPYFSQYFFTCYTFGDPEANRLPPWPGSVAVSWNKALEPIRHHQLSPTGKAIRALLNSSAPDAN